ncbi:MAG TPA: response regulator [Thermoanaerobaculia bacterium]|nr:response regulator [Thermoanaerobaculia bacterium]
MNAPLDSRKLKLLVVEDVEDDALLVERHLRKAGFAVSAHRVKSELELRHALAADRYDMVISDYNIPGFGGLQALAIVQDFNKDLPFILVSGTVGEETAIDAMHMGAGDYVLKDNLVRLAPAVHRGLEQAFERSTRRAAEAALREAEARSAAVLNSLSAEISVIDQTGNIVDVNLAWLEFAEAGNLRLRTWTAVNYLDVCDRAIHSPDAREAAKGIRSVLSGQSSSFTMEYHCPTPAEDRWFMLCATPLTTKEGAVLSHIDISARRKTEIQLENEQKRLREAQSAARLGDWEWNLATATMCWGKEVFTIFEMDPTTDLKVSDSVLVARLLTDDRSTLDQSVVDAVTGEREINLDVRIRRLDDSIATLHLTGKRATGKESLLVGTVQDISDRKMLESQLEQANRLNSLGRLAATVAHEFNNVLMGIQPFCEMIIRKADDVELVSGAAKTIQQSVLRGSRISHEILRYTQPNDPRLEPLRLSAWLREISPELQNIFGPQVQISIDDVAPDIVIAADKAQLQQIFINFAVNSRDAMPSGGTFCIRASHRTSASQFRFGVVLSPDRFAHIVVSDNGTGMPADVLDRAFEPLFTTKAQSGTGLGLAVTRQIVANHEGHIFVESQEGKGTTFHLFFPLTSEVPTEIAQGIVEKRSLPSSLLLVEDEEAISDGLAALLEMDGISVQVAATGAAALKELEAHEPEIIVLDVGLPDIDGKDLYVLIAARHPGIPVIFSTGHGNLADIQHLVDQGKAQYLLKPYEFDDLLETISTLMKTSPRGA